MQGNNTLASLVLMNVGNRRPPIQGAPSPTQDILDGLISGRPYQVDDGDLQACALPMRRRILDKLTDCSKVSLSLCTEMTVHGASVNPAAVHDGWMGHHHHHNLPSRR